MSAQHFDVEVLSSTKYGTHGSGPSQTLLHVSRDVHTTVSWLCVVVAPACVLLWQSGSDFEEPENDKIQQ